MKYFRLSGYSTLLLLAFAMLPAFSPAQGNCNCGDFNETTARLIYKAAKERNAEDAMTLINLQKKSSDPCCQAIGFTMEAMINRSMNKFEACLTAVKKSETLLAGKYNMFSSPENQRMLGEYYGNMVNVDSSAYCYLRGLDMAVKDKNTLLQAKFYNNLALLFLGQKQGEKGLEYQKKSVAAALLTNDDAAAAQAYTNLVTAYGFMNEQTSKDTYLDSVYITSLTALKYAHLSGDNYFIQRNYGSLSQYYIGKNNLNEALIYNDSLFGTINEKTNLQIILNANRVRGQIMLGLKQYDQSIAAYKKTLGYVAQMKNPLIEKEVYSELYKAYKASDDKPAALDALEKSKAISDSLVTKQNSAIITEMEQKYKKTENERTIKELAQQKRIWILLAIAGLLALVALVFFIRQQSLKNKKTILETEQRLNRARMNPHFFFNALSSLQKFALKENDGQAMASNLSRFSNIMRETLESTYKEYVTIEQEMEFLVEYLEVQKIRFPQTFSYEVTAADNLEIDELHIPAMIIQPFVENSIEHGFAGVDYPGNVRIRFTSENKELLIEIKDNGKGLNTGIKENKAALPADNEHISRASQIIKDRIYLLNIKLKTKAGFSIDNAFADESNPSGNGVVVKIHLPLIYK